MAPTTRTDPGRRRASDLAWTALRPLLRLQLEHFRHVIRSGTFPATRSAAVDPAADVAADRVAWLGSTASARFGVVDDDLTTLSRVAAAVGGSRRRGFAWLEVAPRALTVREAADRSSAEPAADEGAGGRDRAPGDGAAPVDPATGAGTDVGTDVDATVVALGFSDVLLMTSVADWTADLDRLLDAARHPGRVLSPVLVAGIPPMDRFRQAPRLGRVRIRHQVRRLNAASEALVRRRGDCVFVPFPDTGDASLGHEYWSWSTVHQLWSAALAPELTRVLDEDA